MLAQRIVAAVLLLGSLVVFWHTVVSVDRSPEKGFFYDLPPFDAIEYYAAAASLRQEGSFLMWVDGKRHPTLYPFGYSLLIAAAAPLLSEPIAAPFAVNVLASALILVLMGLTTWRLHGPAAAGVVALLTACLPSFILLGNSPMSETSGALLLVASVCGWLLYAERGRLGWALAASFLLGASLWFRTASVFFLPMLGTAVLLRPGQPLARRLRDGALFGAVAALGALPVFAYNTWYFGSPLKTGYHYWTGPGVFANLGLKPRFSVEYLPGRLVDLGREILDLNMPFTTANLFGNGSHVGPVLVLLLVIAFGFALRSRTWRCIGVATAIYTLALLCYYRYFGRLFLPVYLVAILCTGPLVAALLRQPAGNARRLAGAATAVLVLAGAAGVSRPGVPPELLALWDTRRFERHKATAYLLVTAIDDARAGEPCLVISDVLSPYVRALTGPEVVALALESERQFEHFRPYARDDAAVGRALVEWAERDRCVIVGLAGRYDELSERLAPPDGFRWREVYRRPHKGNRDFGAARLERIGGVPGA